MMGTGLTTRKKAPVHLRQRMVIVMMAPGSRTIDMEMERLSSFQVLVISETGKIISNTG